MRISDWSSDVCSSDLLVRSADPGEHGDIARRMLELRGSERIDFSTGHDLFVCHADLACHRPSGAWVITGNHDDPHAGLIADTHGVGHPGPSRIPHNYQTERLGRASSREEGGQTG